MTAHPAGDSAEVERVARAMQAVSYPSVNPDQLTPGPRGSVGLMPVWRLYEHMARAAVGALTSGSSAGEVQRLREALEPFADDLYPGEDWGDDVGGPQTMATAGMVRRARTALRSVDGEASNG